MIEDKTTPPRLDIRHLFNAYVACPRRLWLKVHKPELGAAEFFPFSYSLDALIRIAGDLKGPLEDAEESYEQTSQLIREKRSAINLAFLIDGYHLRIDLMTLNDEGWHLYLVKPFPQVRFGMVREVVLQAQFLKEVMPISKVSILTINGQYTRRTDLEPHAFFNESDITEDPLFHKRDLSLEFDKIKLLLETKIEPDVPLSFSCVRPFDCLFKGHCWSHLPTPSIFDVTGIPIKKKFLYYSQNIISYEETINAQIPLTPRQDAQLKTHFSGSILLDHEKLSQYLETIVYPITFLDFEALQSVIPPYPGTNPYQQIPFQFSAHIQTKKGAPPVHVEFVADLQEDPRPAFAKALAEKLPNSGTVLIYGGGFELSTTKTLARAFPEFQDELTSLHDRMMDLIRPFEERYIYSKEMKGSLSFKDVLPALVPDCTYQSLEIANGQMVSNASERLLYTKDAQTREHLLKHLSAYCRQDTYGMVRLVEKLHALIDTSKP